MKTTFDLPDRLLRQAKAVAAEQGRPLRDLVAEALRDKLAHVAAARRGFAEPSPAPALEVREEAPVPWGRKREDGRAALRAALIRQPDGSYTNVLGIEGKEFFEALDEVGSRPHPPHLDRLFDDTP